MVLPEPGFRLPTLGRGQRAAVPGTLGQVQRAGFQCPLDLSSIYSDSDFLK